MTQRAAPPLASRLIRVLALFGALAAAACAGILPGSKEPPRYFELSPKSTFPPDLPKVDWQLTVEVPVAGTVLNTPRIALRRSPFSLEYYARAIWIDRAPVMVQKLLVESFDNTGKIVAAARQAVTPRADYSLITELREFQAEYDGAGPPKVRVRINAKLLRLPRRNIIATTSAEHVQRAAGTELESIINAFDVALGKTMKEIVVWTLTTPPRSAGRSAPRQGLPGLDG